MQRKLAWFVLATGLALRVAIVLAKPKVLWIDDTFYSLGIARNIALGNGWTHDGIHVTNGFQPLYVFLMVPFYYLLPPSGYTIPTIALMMESVFSVATGYILYRLLTEYVGWRGALVALVGWSYSPYIIKSVNGLETPLYLFLLMLVTYLYLRHWRDVLLSPRESLSCRLRIALYLGLLCGLLSLTRVDSVIYVGVLFLDLAFWKYRAARISGENLDLAASIKALAAMGLSFVAPMLLWLWLSYVHAGRLGFDSGTATRLGSIAEYHGSNIILSNAAELRSLRYSVLTPILPWVAWPIPHLLLFASVGLVAALVALTARTSGIWPKIAAFLKSSSFLYLYGILLVLAYVTYQYTTWMWPRYFYPIALIGLILLGSAVESIMAGLDSMLRKRNSPATTGSLAYWCLLTLYLAASPYSVTHVRFNPILAGPDDAMESTEWQAAAWLRENTDSDARVGAFQSGILGYFSERTVVNLDGVVNRDAIPYVVENNTPLYLEQEGVSYLLDWTWIIAQQDFSLVPDIEVDEMATFKHSNAGSFDIVILKLQNAAEEP